MTGTALRGDARLFLALDPPPAVRARLAALAAREVGGRGGRPVAGPDLHLTLCFLGPVPPERHTELLRAVERTAAAAPAGVLGRLTGVTLRPSDTHARLCAAEVADRGGLSELWRAAAGNLAAAAGRPADERPFWPHITLGRFRTPVAGGSFVLGDEQVFAFDRLALYASRHDPGTATRYTPVAAHPLTPVHSL